ncbi:helix-turn-helix transcriptional regulator [Pelagibius litoralis]|uniref:Helix-turn-helix transcriptional regulator n=1 Tax=Pelagibius litoralis TaxID=374515 RepID=A0A967EY19_9PROT|nr:helix-turn-helix transcriptional regulator [Pelagibius litoralis]NIA69532.1 helix-turn-helix transcriptional regulator [Pelagibius litoralis]
MKSLNKVIEGIYEASADDDLWPCTMGEIRNLLHGARCLLFTPHIDPAETHCLWASPDLPTEDLQEYVDYYHQHDLWTINAEAQALIRSGKIFVGQDVVSDEQFEKSEWFNDFVQRLEIRHLIAATVSDGKSKTGVPRTMISVYGGLKSNFFNEKDIQLYQILVPHIQNSLFLRHKFISLKAESRTIERLLNSQLHPVLLLNEEGLVMGMNEVADDFFVNQATLHLRRGKLYTDNTNEQNGLDRAIADAVRTHQSPEYRPVSTFVQVTNLQSCRPYSLRVCPLPPSQVSPIGGARAIIEVTDPSSVAISGASTVAAYYELTRAERALCESLLEGHPLAKSATLLGITYGTARQRLKAIFRKTDSNSQPELMRLLMTYRSR